MAPAAKKAKAKAAPAASTGAAGRGKRKVPPEPPQLGLLKWFAPKAAATTAGDSQSAPADSQGSVTGGASGDVADVTHAVSPPLPPPLVAEESTGLAVALSGGVSAEGDAAKGDAAAESDAAAAGQESKDDGIRAGRQDFADAWSNNKFSRGVCNWLSQYHSSYASRLQKLRPLIEAQVRDTWPQVNLLPAIKGYRRSHRGVDVALVGVLFKEMKSRPNVAVLYRDSNALAGSLLQEAARVGPGSLCSDDDVMWLEDGSMRLELRLPAEWCAALATGFVVAVRGAACGDGRFGVKALSLARIPAPPRLVLSQPGVPSADDGASPPFLALASGLALGAPGAEGAAEARGRAVDFLVGSGRVQRLIVCGGLLAKEATADGLESAVVRAALEEADALLAHLAAALPVDVMPGAHDPTNLSLPQLPLHPYLFRRLRRCRSFKSVSNPYECSLRGGFRVLGHSGQPVQDLLRCSRLPSPIHALRTSLNALHLAPTAPDSLPAQPCPDGDPFVVDAVPHVLFSGGHDAEEHEWFSPTRSDAGTTCVCVPAFHVSPQLVLINLHDPREVQVPDFGQGKLRR